MLERTDEQQDTETGLTKSETDMEDAVPKLGELPDVTEGTEVYRDMRDCIFRGPVSIFSRKNLDSRHKNTIPK